jgi:outer membrane protein assembly factor BamA
MYDSRDNPLNATRGMRVLSSAMLFRGFTGSVANFNRFDTDIRIYRTIHNRGVIAAQLVSGNTTGNVPVRMLPMAGGESIMRGYYLGRYRDRHLAAAQIEYRTAVWNWVGVAAFAGYGTVYNQTSTLQNHQWLPNYGAGLRLRLDKKDNVNLRFDYGFGKNTSGFYVSFGEAF